MTAESLPLRFQLGARTLAAVPRRLVRVPLTLADALADRVPALPPLDEEAHGWLVTSLPAGRIIATPGTIAQVRQRYTRRFVDLSIGEAAWWRQLSANTRSQLRRKARVGGAVERAATPDALARLLPAMRALAATTYQVRLLGAALPADEVLLAQAAADGVRGWLLRLDDRPAAFLLCGADGDTLRYDHVGHDPACADRSPGTVLHLAALSDLFAEQRFARFDFLEGDGQHKRTFATGGVDALDLLLLRRTVSNRLAAGALAGWDAGVEAAKGSALLRRAARAIGR